MAQIKLFNLAIFIQDLLMVHLYLNLTKLHRLQELLEVVLTDQLAKILQNLRTKLNLSMIANSFTTL
jgi:hypothetical protein